MMASRTEALPILRSTFAPPISAIFDIKPARLFLRFVISSRSRDRTHREREIASFAKTHGWRLRYYKEGFCAIFDKDPSC
jgi:hypothetical protein